jgi:alanine dehydrogenase
MNTTQAPKQKPGRIPNELLKEISNAKFPMTIGIPKENLKEEKRLAFTPEAVDMIAEAGHKVLLETGAGAGINYSDTVYSEAGAEIRSKEEVFGCDLIFKIAPPTLEEITLMKKKATVFSALQLLDMSAEMIHQMAGKSVHAVGYELISADGRNFPVRNSISEIEGAAAISVASELLSNERGGKGILLGGVTGVPPTEVVIIGAGVAGTVAARTALSIGAVVKVFDNDILKLHKLQRNVGIPVFTSVFHPNVLVNAFKSADLVIGALRFDDTVRYVISEDVLRTMKKGSLIIDLRISQGGCFETTCFLSADHPKIFEKKGILHYCMPNLSSRVARTTSMALSNVFTPYIVRMGDAGGLSGMIKSDILLRSGHYMYSGKLVNSYVAKHFNLPSHDIGLFLSAF